MNLKPLKPGMGGGDGLEPLRPPSTPEPVREVVVGVARGGRVDPLEKLSPRTRRAVLQAMAGNSSEDEPVAEEGQIFDTGTSEDTDEEYFDVRNDLSQQLDRIQEDLGRRLALEMGDEQAWAEEEGHDIQDEDDSVDIEWKLFGDDEQPEGQVYIEEIQSPADAVPVDKKQGGLPLNTWEDIQAFLDKNGVA